MTALSDLVTRVRVALGVAATYEADVIPAGINRSINKLLRDYNFPKSGRRTQFDIAAGQDTFVVPDGFKKPVLVRWINPADGSYSKRLDRREGVMPPNGRGFSRYYWLLGENLYVDTPFALEYAVCKLELYWQSLASADNQWMLVDLEDILFTYSTYRLAADVRKPEVMQAFGALWQEDRQSLAIFANELEFEQLEVTQHEPERRRRERYPRGVECLD